MIRRMLPDPGALAVAGLLFLAFVYLREVLAAMVWLARFL